MQNLIQLLIGSLVLSAIHVTIPNHWLPLVAISKTENWSRGETLGVASITAVAHTVSTILLGVVVGVVGYKLSSTHEIITRLAAPLILLGMGLVYLFFDLKGLHHFHSHIDVDSNNKKSKSAIILSLSIAMFFSPCIEIEAYYFIAGTLGWFGIGAVSIVYLIVTVLGTLILVYLGSKGMERIRWHFLEHHEKMLTGLILVILGLLAYFVEF
jgi:cytochrome c biogenesis protein CcdA